MDITILKIILCLLLLLFITIFLQTHETIIEGNISGKGKKMLGGGNKKKKFFGGGNKKGKGSGGGDDGGSNSGAHNHDDEYLRKGKAIKLGNLTCDKVEFSQEDGLSCSNVIVEGGEEVDDDD